VFRNGDNSYAVTIDSSVVAYCAKTLNEAQEIARNWREANAHSIKIKFISSVAGARIVHFKR